MKKIYYEDEKFDKTKKSIFLAGPTPRNGAVKSWRDDAIKILEELNFDGEVYIPESRVRGIEEDFLTYNGVIDWELERQDSASIIMFWVPRDLTYLPAFTTNVEFGYRLRSGKIIYGRPQNAPKTKYLDALYKKEYGMEPFNDLRQMLIYCVKQLNTEIKF